MNDAIFTQLQKEMDLSVGALRKELAKLRTGRASTGLLEHVVVEYYGATTPLNQLATLSAPEPRLLVIQPFDRSAMGDIEKAGLLKMAFLGLRKAYREAGKFDKLVTLYEGRAQAIDDPPKAAELFCGNGRL